MEHITTTHHSTPTRLARAIAGEPVRRRAAASRVPPCAASQRYRSSVESTQRTRPWRAPPRFVYHIE